MKTENYPINILTRETHPLIWKLIPKPPEQLYVQGLPSALNLLDLIPDRGLAIVGTRYPTLHSVRLVQKTLQELKRQNLVLLSGLAIGIDRTAHQAALDSGLPTIAILGAPLDVDYPRDNHALRQDILFRGGLVVSEFAPQSEVHAWNFPRRNRIIAAWAHATWMVEAAQRSGALSTLQWALKLPGKTCYVTPCFPNDPSYAGNQQWLDQEPSLQCFWGTSSLGSTWLELASLKHRKSKTQSLNLHLKSAQEPDADLLIHGLKHLGGAQQSIPVHEVLDHFMDRPQWDVKRFFQAAQNAIQAGYVIEQNGGWILREPA